MSSNRAFSAIGRKKTEFSANINDKDGSSSSEDQEKKIDLNQFEPVEEEEVHQDTDKNSLVEAVVDNNIPLFATFVPQTGINNSIEEEEKLAEMKRSNESSLKLYDLDNMADKEKQSFYRKSSLAD